MARKRRALGLRFRLSRHMADSPFPSSVFEAEPGEEGHFDDDEREGDGEEVPAPDVVPKEAVFEEDDGKAGGDDAGNGGGAAAVLEETFVDEFAEDGDFC